MEFFKVCPCCGYEWHDRDAFIADENVAIIGYQPHFKEQGKSLIDPRNGRWQALGL